MSEQIAFVGCRTTRERNARGQGLSVFATDPDGQTWVRRQCVAGLPNPSYLAAGPQATLYAVHGDGSDLSAFRVGPEGLLTALGCWSTGGRNPVHLAVTGSHRFLVIANYASGTIARRAILSDGRLGDAVEVLMLRGQPGPHRDEQTGSHPHQILPDPSGRRLIVPDKGLDRIFVVEQADGDALRLNPALTLETRAGAGPRHGCFHPRGDRLSVVNELDSTVTTFRYDPETGAAAPLQTVATLPHPSTGENRAAGIAATRCGRWIFVSNRGHDSIATFAVDPVARTLAAKTWTSSGGATPRFITLSSDDATLLVANEGSDTIVSFAVDITTGRLTLSGPPVRTGSPVCVVLIPAPTRTGGSGDWADSPRQHPSTLMEIRS